MKEENENVSKRMVFPRATLSDGAKANANVVFVASDTPYCTSVLCSFIIIGTGPTYI